MLLGSQSSSIRKASCRFQFTAVRDPSHAVLNSPRLTHPPVVPTPWQFWTPAHKAAILPLYLLFTISWSLEMYVRRSIFHFTCILCGADDRVTSAPQGHASGRALLLALPRQLWLGTAGLVPKLVLQNLDRRRHRRGHVHATSYHLHEGRPPQGTPADLPLP